MRKKNFRKSIKRNWKKLEDIIDKFLEKMKEAEAEEKVYKSEKNNVLTGYSPTLVSELGDLKKEKIKQN